MLRYGGDPFDATRHAARAANTVAVVARSIECYRAAPAEKAVSTWPILGIGGSFVALCAVIVSVRSGFLGFRSGSTLTKWLCPVPAFAHGTRKLRAQVSLTHVQKINLVCLPATLEPGDYGFAGRGSCIQERLRQEEEE